MRHKTRWICVLTALLVLFAQTTAAFAEKQEDWMLAIYLVGSDLESDHSLAMQDLAELMLASYNSDTAVYVCTGGSKEWSFPIIPSDECIVWKIAGGGITKIASLGARNMGEAQTLSAFIELLPPTSSKKALIFWNHGAGPVIGLCNDENFNNDPLLLPEIARGLKNGPHWELIGADACSLACIELTRVLKNHANYAVLSQETEPADGWDYASLMNGLSSASDGAEAGALIADTALLNTQHFL